MEARTSERRKAAIWAAAVVGLGVIAVAIVALPRMGQVRSLAGAVLVANTDPRKQLPIANVEITAEAGGTETRTVSDSSGYFRLTWRGRMWRGEKVTLKFRHPDYQPLETTQSLGNQVYIARMSPSPSVRAGESRGEEVSIGDIRVRYAVKATTTIDIGSTAKTFEVINTGNVPCEKASPCSPDGNWKAVIGSFSLKADDREEFQNVRVSCIAGPCPFTKIESDAYKRGGPRIEVTVRAWSDTVTFLVEAEVARTMISDAIRHAYPSFFGRDMSFTLPPTGQGPCIEAEVNGAEVVYPLGPDLDLSWASCSVQAAANTPKLYSCRLKQGYRFR